MTARTHRPLSGPDREDALSLRSAVRATGGSVRSLPAKLVGALAVLCILAMALPASVHAAAKARPKVDSVTLSQRGDHYRINITYPQLGTPAADAEISIWARDQAATFIESVQQIPTPLPIPYELTIGYETITASPRAVSAVFTITTYMGGTHPMPGLATFAYNRKDGRRLTYGDIFLNMDGVLDAFSTLCRESLSAQLGSRVDSRMLEEGTTPDMANFDLFAVTATGLRIYFPPYQAAPGNEGYLHVDIPLEKLTQFKPQRSFWADGAQ